MSSFKKKTRFSAKHDPHRKYIGMYVLEVENDKKKCTRFILSK